MAVSVVQSSSVNHTYSGSLTSAATVGNTLLLCVAGDNNSTATSSAPLYNGGSVPGSKRVFEVVGTATGLMYAALWMLPNVPSSGTTFSITCTATSINGSLTAVEIAGLGSSPLVQGTPLSAQGATTASLGPTSALSSAPALVAFFGSAYFGWTASDNAGYAKILTMSNNGCFSYQTPATSGGSYSWAGSVGSGDGWAAGLALITSSTPNGLLMASFP